MSLEPNATATRQRRALWILALLLILLTAVSAVRVRARLEPVAVLPDPPLAVETLELEPARFVISRSYTGTLDARQRVVISSRLTAAVTGIPFREGEEVAAGSPLVRLDDRELVEEQARLEAAEERIRADLAFWQTQLKRDEKLFQAGTVPEKNRDESRRMVNTLQASLRENREGQSVARTRRGYTELDAPFAGRVQAVHILPGEMAVPGKALLELVAAAPLEAVVSVPQSDLAELRTGLSAEVLIPAIGARVTGRVDQIYPALDADTRTATLQVLVPEPGPGLVPGMQAEVTVILQAEEDALTLPIQAVHERSGESGVFVAENGVARWRPVVVGESADRGIRVKSGVRPGEQVVVTPDPRLRDGRALWLPGVGDAS